MVFNDIIYLLDTKKILDLFFNFIVRGTKKRYHTTVFVITVYEDEMNYYYYFQEIIS